ncbi:predicted protein [Chaetoceros tenuissimus]|uniref:SAM domain-containing protein n=1 Tax=Chaetoceros tenuissimus TaxID=426638 RepID=A0AAD3CWA7_9STRA|nr:predicted protein [Chaetoceros tenuissimus]
MNPTLIAPVIAISTLSSLLQYHEIRNRSAKKESSKTIAYQVALLLSLQLSHALISFSHQNGDTTKIQQYQDIILISYAAIFLALLDACTSLIPSTKVSQRGTFAIMNGNASRYSTFKALPCNNTFKSFLSELLSPKAVIHSMIPSTTILLYVTVYLELITDENEKDRKWIQYVTFLSSTVCIHFYHILKMKKRSRKNQMNGTNMNIHSSKSTMKPDERSWEQWSTNQVLQWISCIYTSENSSVHASRHSSNIKLGDGDLDDILDIVSRERIHGACLPALNMNDLRSFGMSYGEAMVLLCEISELMQQFPPTKVYHATSGYSIRGVESASSNRNSHDGIDLDEWLGRKNLNSEQPAPQPMLQVQAPQFPPQPQVNTVGNSSSQAGTSSNIHKDLIEMRLAEIKAKSGISNDIESPVPPPSSTLQTQQPPIDINNIDPKILETMPPGVREIAKRRPDLVQALIQNKQEQMKHDANKLSPIREESTNQGLDGVIDQDMDSIEAMEYHEDHFGEDGMDEEYGFGSDDFNDEMVGLVRRRRK